LQQQQRKQQDVDDAAAEAAAVVAVAEAALNRYGGLRCMEYGAGFVGVLEEVFETAKTQVCYLC
jgi:hypothetical protein